MTRAAASRFRKLAADLDRLNHVLIPRTKEERDRFRDSRAAGVARRMLRFFERFTADGQVLLLLVLPAGLVAMDVKRSHVFIAWSALVALLAASFAVASRLQMSGVQVRVAVARRITVGEETVFTLAVRNEGAIDHDSVAVRGAFLPWDASWTVRRAGIRTLPSRGGATVELAARFHTRGVYRVDPFSLRLTAPLGFAYGPAVSTEAVRVLAVPRIANVVVERIQGRRHQPGGVPRASRTADSRELCGVRPYRPGDPVRDLHARTWARVGVPAVREYREEYFSRVGVVLDTDVAQGDEEVFEAAVSLVAGVVNALGNTEALVDVMVLGTTAYDMTVGRSLGTLDHALELLACVRPEGPFDGGALAARVGDRLARLSSLVVVALRWDDARRAFAAGVTATGTNCVVFVVGDDAAALRSSDLAVIHVAPEAVAAGRPIRL